MSGLRLNYDTDLKLSSVVPDFCLWLDPLELYWRFSLTLYELRAISFFFQHRLLTDLVVFCDYTIHKVRILHGMLSKLVFLQQQNPGECLVSKINLGPPWLRFLSVLRRWFCCWLFIVYYVRAIFLFCNAVLCVLSSFVIISLIWIIDC